MEIPLVDTLNYSELDDKTLSELREIAKEQGLGSFTRLKKTDLIFR